MRAERPEILLKHGLHGRSLHLLSLHLLGGTAQQPYPTHTGMTDRGQPHVFPAKIQKIWIMRCIDVPRDVSKAIRQELGENAMHVPVRGWIEGLPFQNTLVPRGGGNYRFHIHSRIWRKLRIDAGAAVEVTLLLDSEPREAALPPDLAAGLADTPHALATFNTLSVALRRHIVQYVDSARQVRTREKRIQLVLNRMLERAARRTKKRKKQPRLAKGMERKEIKFPRK